MESIKTKLLRLVVVTLFYLSVHIVRYGVPTLIAVWRMIPTIVFMWVILELVLLYLQSRSDESVSEVVNKHPKINIRKRD